MPDKKEPSAIAKEAARRIVPLYKQQQQDPDFRARFNRNEELKMNMNPAHVQAEPMAKIHKALDLAASEEAKKKETLEQALTRLSNKPKGDVKLGGKGPIQRIETPTPVPKKTLPLEHLRPRSRNRYT